MSQGVRGAAWTNQGPERLLLPSSFPSSQTILWMYVQMLPKCQSPSLVLNSLKPPHYSVSLMNSEYSKGLLQTFSSGIKLTQIAEKARAGARGRSLFLNPMLLMLAKLLLVLWKFAPGGLGRPHLWNNLGPSPGSAASGNKMPIPQAQAFPDPQPRLVSKITPDIQDLQRPLPELSTTAVREGGWKAERI